MTTNAQLRMDWINRGRRTAALFIKASDEFKSMAAEYDLLDLDLSPEEGGLTETDFNGMNEGITPEDMAAFLGILSTLLGGLTEEQMKIIYKVKASNQSLMSPGSVL